jgi:hypothetical protein
MLKFRFAFFQQNKSAKVFVIKVMFPVLLILSRLKSLDGLL